MQDLKRLNFLIDAAAAIYGSDNKLAEALDVHRQQVSNWRHGNKAPGYELQERMAQMAGLDPAIHVMAAAVEKTGHSGAMKLLRPFTAAWQKSSLLRKVVAQHWPSRRTNIRVA